MTAAAELSRPTGVPLVYLV